MVQEFCFICLKNANFLVDTNASDKRNFKEFTSLELIDSIQHQICLECRRNLLKSLKFQQLCKKSQKNVEIIEYDTNEEYLNFEPENEEKSTTVVEVIEVEVQEKLKCSLEGCEKQFSNSMRLKNHMRTHTKEKPYACEYCSMKFTQSNALLCHKRIHLNEKPYVCQVCGKKFTQNTTLKTHIASKHVGNQVQCDHPGCSKKFPRKSFLVLHKKRDHENIRDYSCEECEKSYKQKSHLDRHVEATHKNIRHQCLYCEKSFSKSWSLKLHQFKHTEASNFPYKCVECDMKFQRRDVWLKHMQNIHPGIDVRKDPIEIKMPIVITK